MIRKVEPKLTAALLPSREKPMRCICTFRCPTSRRICKELLKEGIESQLTLDLPKGKYQAEWMDTKTGKVANQQTLNHNGGQATLKSPAFANDIALRILGS